MFLSHNTSTDLKSRRPNSSTSPGKFFTHFSQQQFSRINEQCLLTKTTTITLCLEKVPTFKLSVTLSNLNRFSKILHCLKAYKICNETHTTLPTSPLGMLLHYLGKLKIQIFCRYSATMEKMQTSCIFIVSDFIIHH